MDIRLQAAIVQAIVGLLSVFANVLWLEKKLKHDEYLVDKKRDDERDDKDREKLQAVRNALPSTSEFLQIALWNELSVSGAVTELVSEEDSLRGKILLTIREHRESYRKNRGLLSPPAHENLDRVLSSLEELESLLVNLPNGSASVQQRKLLEARFISRGQTFVELYESLLETAIYAKR